MAHVSRMPTPSEPGVIRLSSLPDLVAVVPALIGFQPTESLVVVTLRGPRHRAGLTLRVDLPERAGERSVVDSAVAAVRRSGAESSVVFVCTDDPTARPHARLVKALHRALTGAGVDVLDCVLVRAGRCWSYRCTQACCPPQGRPVPPPNPALVAALVAQGRAVLDDRTALVASIAPVAGRRAAAMASHLRRERRRRAMGATDAAVELEDIRRWLQAHVDGQLPDDPTAARIIAACDDPLVRDGLIAGLAGREPHDLLPLLVQLATLTVPPHDAEVLTVLAFTAYVVGNGALANVALDRALDSDPGHRAATLLRHGIDRALPPATFRELTAQVAAGVTARLDSLPGAASA